MLKFILLLFPLFLFAHQSGLSYISINESKNHTISVVYKSPLQDINANKIQINYPHDCIKSSTKPQRIESGFIIQSYSLSCKNNTLLDKRVWIDGLIKQNRGVLVEYSATRFKQQALLRADKPFILIKRKNSSFELFVSYLKLGIYHILSGYDHLLFVLSLLLLAKNIKVLLLAVTAFTLSHSITLAAAVLNIVNLPVAFIEAMIALSILFLARELVKTDTDTLTKRHLEYIAFIFGLLHGFGFSNVLRSIGVAQDDIALSLFSFNLGIELGQLLFIFAMSALYLLIKRVFNRVPKDFKVYDLKIYMGYFVGVVSAFWFIQRVLSF